MRRCAVILGFLCCAALLASNSAVALAEKLPVVATFSILGDLTQRIGGDHVAVTTLVGSDGDAHVFEPGADDQRAVAKARLVIANGLGFEPWLDRLVEAAGFKGGLIIASDGVTPLQIEEQSGDEAGTDHHGGVDPHAFQDLANGRIYVANIAAALIGADPDHAADYRAGADRLIGEMVALDADLKLRFDVLPRGKRRVLTTHDAFQYFGRAYGFDFVAIQGLSTSAEPSAADLARLIDEAKAGGIRAIFLENMSNPTLAQSVAGDSGVKLGGALIADALTGPDGVAPDYLSMFRANAKELLAALR